MSEAGGGAAHAASAARTAPAVLTLNVGSSSVKFALYERRSPPGKPLFTGQVAGLGAGGRLHDDALAEVLTSVRERAGAWRVAAVGHRIVHGGTTFAAPARVDDAVLAAIEALAPLAPLHQPHNAAGVRAARTVFPGVPQVACFDTAFHRTQVELQQRFAIPRRWHDAGVRRYGFHGLSYEAIAARLLATEPALAAGRVVVAHLGNGCSMCALAGGRSVATTMSFSPLDGLVMGTRSGRIDAAVVWHLMRHHGLEADTVERLLTRESGLVGLSDGLSSDMRTLLASEAPAARLAVDHFVEAAARELAVMAAALRGIDGVVFTGGIGENAAAVRERIVEAAAWMGLAHDPEANARHARDIGTAASRVALRVLATDEEGVIAAHTIRTAGL